MARSKQALRELAGLSRNPARFFPKWEFEDRGTPEWTNLKRTHEAGATIAAEMRAYAAELDSDDSYSAEGRARLKREHYEKVIGPKFEGLREKILADVRHKARSAVILAEHEALEVPQDRFEVAAAMRALDRIHKGVNTNGAKKLNLPKLEQLDPEVKRAIAATSRIVSGLSENDHAAIRKQVFAEEGGKALADARELLAAVETAAESLDYGQTVAGIEAGIPSRSPEAEQRLAAVQ